METTVILTLLLPTTISDWSVDQGEYCQALEYFLKSLDIRKSVYGENHPDVAISSNPLCVMSGKKSRPQNRFFFYLPFCVSALTKSRPMKILCNLVRKIRF